MRGGCVQVVAIIGLYTVLVLWPLRRPRALAALGFFLSHLVNELPGLARGALLTGTALALIGSDPGSAGGAAMLALAASTAAGLLEVARRGPVTRRVVERSLEQELGRAAGRLVPGRWSSWRRLACELLAPLPWRPRSVQGIRNISYGPGGRRNRLDLYRRRDLAASAGPVLIHFHGGHFQMGSKSREARPLHRLAGQGWVCISATYRLGAAGRFPGSLIDAKRVIGWPRSHGAEYGADTSAVIVAGSSAGAHLAAMAALTPNDPAFQPGFEDADTSVSAAVCLSGYYGERGATTARPSSPHAYIGRDAPPFLIAATARTTRSSSFDLFHSPRFDAVIDAIEAFTACTLAVRPQRSLEAGLPPGSSLDAATARCARAQTAGLHLAGAPLESRPALLAGQTGLLARRSQATHRAATKTVQLKEDRSDEHCDPAIQQPDPVA